MELYDKLKMFLEADNPVKLLAPLGGVRTDNLGNAICTIVPPMPGGSHLLLDAHFDTIGLIVTHIEPGGFLRVAGVGGMDVRAMPAARVEINAAKGRVSGLVCSTPPHLDKGEEKKLSKADELYIDIGLSEERAREKITPGDRAWIVSPIQKLLGGKLAAPWLDNRASCLAVAEAAEILKGEKLDVGLSVIFSSMEEVGGPGAGCAAFGVEPTDALVVDVTFGICPGSDKHKCYKLGGGPTIGFSPILDRKFSARLVETAKAQDIPYQHEVMPGRTGTNADGIAASRAGIPTGLVSIPVRYMHSPVEVVDQADIQNTTNLIVAFVKSFAAGRGI